MLLIRIFAMDRESVRAEEATAARDRKRDHNSVSTAEIPYRRADLFHDAHELVAHDQRLGLRQKPVVHVQIRSADRSRGDFQDDVPRIFQRGILNILNPHILRFMKNNGFHFAN
jgi:hypothetical protein